jgi:hypothetical protein
MPHRGYKPKAIESPEKLWELFIEYKDWSALHPWKKKDFIRSGEDAGKIVDLTTDRPLTIWEFAAFCGLSYQGIKNYGEMAGREGYFEVYKRIMSEMTSQRISGGVAGAYNGNLVARIDGLKEHAEIEGKMEPLIFMTEDGKKLLELSQGKPDAGNQAS